jgi:ribA/ribD-fused uncharacterized protein
MKITDSHVYFWNGIYSNWHVCQVKDLLTDIIFENTEQAFMWYKADVFNDIETKKLVENTIDPRKVKKLGRLIKTYDDNVWSSVRYRKMLYVNLLKFLQNKELKFQLINTGDKIIVEASPLDCVWGVGLSEEDPLILDEKNWKGKNLLGKVLMEVRSIISFNQNS